MEYVTYMLECADGSYYIGWTNNLEKRLYTHNNLKTGARYTKARRPVTLVYSEKFETMSEARKRECALKQLTREKKKALIQSAEL